MLSGACDGALTTERNSNDQVLQSHVN